MAPLQELWVVQTVKGDGGRGHREAGRGHVTRGLEHHGQSLSCTVRFTLYRLYPDVPGRTGWEGSRVGGAETGEQSAAVTQAGP